MVLTGSCQCGSVRYEIQGRPIEVYVCHCLECRKQSSSAFGISVIVAATDFSLRSGALKSWSRPTDSGRTLECAFCENCGSRIWHGSPGDSTISVKGGSLDQAIDLSAAGHIWTSRKLPGVVIPDGNKQFPEEPD
jgi:hypothetical protein